MTSAPQKFVFDTVFGSEGDVVSQAPRPRRLIPAEEVEVMLAEARRQGERAVTAEAERAAAEALGEVAALLGQAMPTLAAVAHTHREGSAALALRAARKIADAALDRFPEAAAAAALAALAREVEAVPRLIVHAPPAQVERLQAALEQTAGAVGYPGQVLVKAGAGLGPAAFVFDWGDGRAAFDPDTAAARIGDALQTALASEGLHGEPMLPADRPETERQDHG